MAVVSRGEGKGAARGNRYTCEESQKSSPHVEIPFLRLLPDDPTTFLRRALAR